MEIIQARTDIEILRCYAVVYELRPHLSKKNYLDQVKRQMKNHGYRLVFLLKDSQVLSVAGFRIAEYLAWGKVCYIDDLVTDTQVQGRGYGKYLFNWLLEEARKAHCQELQLDSGLQRKRAHRFYLNQNLEISNFHFSCSLEI